MALEDVLISGDKYVGLQTEQLAQASEYSQAYAQFSKYLASIGRSNLVDTITPEQLGGMVDIARKDEESKLVKSVKENYDGVVSSLGKDELVNLALNYGASDEIKLMDQALRNQDYGLMSKLYGQEVKEDPLLSYYASTIRDPATLARIVERISMAKKGEFIAKNLSEKGKDKAEFSMEKAQKYVSETISKLDDKKKKEAYLYLGSLFYEIAAQQAAEAEEKAKKEKK
jgi:hypothetical protein